MHSSSELHVPIITVTLLEPEDVVMNVGEGLATDKVLGPSVLEMLVLRMMGWWLLARNAEGCTLP